MTQRSSSFQSVGQRAGRQGQAHGDRALLAGRDGIALGVEGVDPVAGHGQARRPGLDGRRVEATAARRHRPARLGLPPVIDDGAAEHAARPFVGVGVGALAGQEQRAQRRQLAVAEQLRLGILLADRPDGRRRREERGHVVLLDRRARTRRRRACRRACPRRARSSRRPAAARRRCRSGRPPSRRRRPPRRPRRGARRRRSACSTRARRRVRRCRARRPSGDPSCPTCRGCRADRSRPRVRRPPARAAATSSSQSWSRPACNVAVSCGRCRITQCCGACAASSSAASSSGLYAIVRAPSSPQEADTTTLGRASSMRTASSCAAKPPNTTEWIAPRRAHASIAISACGTIGM